MLAPARLIGSGAAGPEAVRKGRARVVGRLLLAAPLPAVTTAAPLAAVCNHSSASVFLAPSSQPVAHTLSLSRPHRPPDFVRERGDWRCTRYL